MIEDDGYRTSSQYRYWSYTRMQLIQTRHHTNTLAAEKVRAAFQRARATRAQNGFGENSEDTSIAEDFSGDVEIQTLTVDEELKIVQWGCSKILEMGAAIVPPIPPNIVATGIQYLRRFYLTNSPMTYHPKQIMMCALFLATKSDHSYIPLNRFVAELPNVTEEDVKAPEFLLLQGLRFTLDVRHPMRGLEGGVAEMQAFADEGLFDVTTMQNSHTRIGVAADKAKLLLRTAAQMTDAYFLYTPAQIWVAAMYVSDRSLTLNYLKQVFIRLGDAGEQLEKKVAAAVAECAELLSSYSSPEEDMAARKEMKRIGKKLTVCQNPEKVDIVAVTRAKAAAKREGSDSDAEKALKKRKMERERLEQDGDVFGPELKSTH